MPDQAEPLRQLVKASTRDRGAGAARLVAVASGKGGVGKSNIVLNLALALADYGNSIAIIDGDLGFSNLDILLGLCPKYGLQDVMDNRIELADALTEGPRGISFVSGGGETLLENQSDWQLRRLVEQLAEISGQFDRIFIDFGAGFGRHTAELIGLCDELLLVTTPEPTALADAYTLLKLVLQSGGTPRTRLLVNRTDSVTAGMDASRKLQFVVRQFLRLDMELLGYLLEDAAVQRAVAKQHPFVLSEPHSLATRCVVQIAKNALCDQPLQPNVRHGIGALLRRFTT